jgi:hypothetical protein
VAEKEAQGFRALLNLEEPTYSVAPLQVIDELGFQRLRIGEGSGPYGSRDH